MSKGAASRRGGGVRYVPVLLCCVAVTVGVARADSKRIERYIAHLENPERAAWQKPDEVVAALGLKGGETVIDLGAGSGYFSVLLAKAVGPTGKVYALDVDQEMLAHLQARIEKDKINNVVTRQVPADDPGLAEKSGDLIFLCNVYHHLSHREDYLKKLMPALKPGGRIAIVDYHKHAKMTEGPPPEARIARETTIGEFRAAGFTLAQEYSFLPYQYFLLFQPVSGGYTVSALTADVEAIVKARRGDKATMQAIAPLLKRFLREGKLDDKFQHLQPGMDITTYLLFAAPDGSFSIAALVVRPGVQIPIHDHQTWTVWGLYKGKEKETPFQKVETRANAFPHLQPLTPHILSAQDISFIRRPPQDVHMVENIGKTVSVSIHIHGTDMRHQTRNRYDLQRKMVIPFVQSYEEGP